MRIMRNAFLLLLFIGAYSYGMAQEKQEKKEYMNSVRFNLTNPMIFGGGSLVFGYERILNKRSSFSINVGQARFPKFVYADTDSLKVRSNLEEKGYNFSVDYRFYLLSENKYAIPR